MYYQNKSMRLALVCCSLLLIATGSPQAFTINGASASSRLLGVPIGGIGAGVFNFLPNGTYSRQYCQTQPPTGMEPTIMIFTQTGTTTWSMQALTTAAGMGISYTGYWPKVTNVYTHASLVIRDTLEAFSPIYPGSNKDCSMPLAFFVFKLSNPTTAVVNAAIACRNNATASVLLSGTKVRGVAGNNITMMVKNSDTTAQVTSGGTVADFTADGLLSNVAGGILASKIVLQPGQEKTITFVIAWDNITNGYYRKYYTTSAAVAQYGYDSAAALKAKVDNWQNKILGSNLPDWYKDVLINNCHVLNSMYNWTNANYAAQQESMSATGALSCFDQRYYASIIVPLFAPDVELYEMQEFAARQGPVGGITADQIPHGLDGNSGDKGDINSEFALCLLRDYLWTGDARFLTLYPNAKRALLRNRNWDADHDGLPDATYSTFDQPMYDGWMPVESEYICDVWLAAEKAGEKLAQLAGDTPMADSCAAWFTQTSASFEKQNGQGGFWNTANAGPTGLKGYYTGSNNVAGKGLACWASQLGGQWYADLLQLGQLHPQGRIDSLVRYIDALNKGTYGYYLAILPDKTNWFGKWPGTNNCGEQWPWFPPSHFGCPAISEGFPDIGIDCVNRQWKCNYTGGPVAPIVWSSPVFHMVNGTDAPNTWGMYRYMNPPGVFSTLFAITGFSIDVANKKLWLKPSIPTSMNKQLINAPLINPNACGTLDYQDMSAISPSHYGQQMAVAFDSGLQIAEIRVKDQDPNVLPIAVDVVKNDVHIPVSFRRSGSDKSAEILLAIPSGGVAIDQNGVVIKIYDPGDPSRWWEGSSVRYSSKNALQTVKTKIFASFTQNRFVLPKDCSPTDIVAVYDLRGTLLLKGPAKSLVNNRGLKLNQGMHIYKIEPVR